VEAAAQTACRVYTTELLSVREEEVRWLLRSERLAGAAAAIGGEPERDGVGDSAYVTISSSKLRDMMSSFIDTVIQVHQDSRGAIVADEDLLDMLLGRPSPART
jgi:hypothetical protein